MSNRVKLSLQAVARAGGAAILLALVGGCLGYRVGNTLPPGVRSIYVPAFDNKCDEPDADTECSRAAIQEFQKDGNLWIRPEDQADATLLVTLVDYSLDPLRFDKDTGKSANEYRVTITAHCILQRKTTGKIMSDKKIRGDTTFQFDGDLTPARSRALPLAAQDLAEKIVDSIVSYW